MTTLENAVVIISSNKKVVVNIKRILKNTGIKNIALVDIFCMNSRFDEIKELLNNTQLLKIFYGCTIKVFDHMVNTFNLQNRMDLKYAKILTPEIITRHYWESCFKIFPATISHDERSFNEEI